MINQDSISVPNSIKFVKSTLIWTIWSLDYHASSVSSKLMRSLKKAKRMRDRKWTYKLLWSMIKRHSQKRRSLQHRSQSLLRLKGRQCTQAIIYSWRGRSQSVRKAQEAHDFGRLWPHTESSSFLWWQTRSWPTSTSTVSVSANQTTPTSVILAYSRLTSSASFLLQVQSFSNIYCGKTRKISWITSTSSIKLSIAQKMQWSSIVQSTLQRKN